ncbi:hypothetical protein [Streptomyces atratus]|uniref:hypothetical protein n=1 Tax=Streptomyces atratus TaxID=1893 RepID=UPI0030B852C9
MGCWSVHTFSGDVKPGDTNGQGVESTWYAVPPTPNRRAPRVARQCLFGAGTSSNVTRSDGPVAHATGV